jgi:Chaperone of endosialidase
MKVRIVCLVVGFLLSVLSMAAQTSGSSPASAQVPPVIQFSDVATDEAGNPLTGTTEITFSLYNNSRGGEPLFAETQNVTLGSSGQYSVYLGITKANGVPTNLFTNGQAHWLGVKIAGQAEQTRVFLATVPYAMKAGDAATVGGLPPSAFVLAAPPNGATLASTADSLTTQSVSPDTSTDVTTTGGTVGYLPLFNGAATIVDSVVFQSAASPFKIGIGTATPATTLDVKGAGTIRGTLSVLGTLALPATGAATATAGKNSEPLSLTTSAYNSSASTAVNQKFQWQAEPAGNDTSAASGTLNLLFGEGTATPAATGLSIASNGQITFATGQTFPGTGDGTVTSVGSGAGLTGGPITGSGTLSIATGGVTNAMLANSSLTITAGTDLTGGGSVALGGTVTLNLNTTKVPQLAASNTFTGNQTVNGNLSATGVVTGSSYQIGSNLFAFGSASMQNVFLGFAGNTTTTGSGNTATGVLALYANTTGGLNTADGDQALESNTTGNDNTASGFQALNANTTGNDNTASGHWALAANTGGSYNTASGSRALTLNAVGSANVGVGYEALYSNVGDSAEDGWYNTAVGNQALYTNNNTSGDGSYAAYNTAIGNQALYSNTTGSANTASGQVALYGNTTGGLNTADGALALESNTTGNSNVAVGWGALSSNTTGYNNTGIGTNALITNTTGSGLTCIGFACADSEEGLSNATAIGAHAVVGASNALVLGGTGKWAVKVGIGTAKPSNILTIAQGAGHPVSDGWETFSSRRWKTNIQTLNGSLEKVEQLRGVSYDLKANGKHEVGVIAEEVGAVVPEVVTWEQNGKDAQSVDYSRLTALLIEATKEQQRELAKAFRQIRQQQNLLRKQDAAMQSLKAEVREDRETLLKVKTQLTTAQPTLVATGASSRNDSR